MEYDYWRMRGWNLVMAQPQQQQDDFKTVEEIVESLDDLFEILEEILIEENDFFVEELPVIEDDEESSDDAYDRAMKGI